MREEGREVREEGREVREGRREANTSGRLDTGDGGSAPHCQHIRAEIGGIGQHRRLRRRFEQRRGGTDRWASSMGVHSYLF